MADQCCLDKILSLKENLEKLKIESKKLKIQYAELLIENLQKDVIIRNRKQQIEHCKYGDFNGIFSDACLDKLRAFGNSQKKDSPFIAIALNDLYRSNVDVIKQKVLSCQPTSTEKSVISPQKLAILDRLYAQRLSYVPSEEVDDFRKRNLKKLIRNAIDNARK